MFEQLQLVVSHVRHAGWIYATDGTVTQPQPQLLQGARSLVFQERHQF